MPMLSVDAIFAFKLHDSGPLAWVVVGAYLSAAGLALLLVRQTSSRERLFWLIVLVLSLALGLNKQLDLQSNFTSFFREMARAQGWYGSRRTVQAFFIAALAGGMLAGGALLVTAGAALALVQRSRGKSVRRRLRTPRRPAKRGA